MSTGVNILALLKNGERYVFLYDDRSSDKLLQTLGQYAADEDLNFSWYDAAVLSQRVRKQRDAAAVMDEVASAVPAPKTWQHHRFRETTAE